MMMRSSRIHNPVLFRRVTGGELFEDIVAREYYSEADARWVQSSTLCSPFCGPHLSRESLSFLWPLRGHLRRGVSQQAYGNSLSRRQEQGPLRAFSTEVWPEWGAAGHAQ